MNQNIYRLKFDKLRGLLVAVSELASTQGKGSTGDRRAFARFRSLLSPLLKKELSAFPNATLYALVFASIFGAAQAQPTQAVGIAPQTSGATSLANQSAAVLPTGGNVVVGSATISNPTPSTLLVQQNSDKIVTNWQTFNVGSGGTVVFNQPSSSSIALNRVIGNTRSEIAGSIIANGKVYLLNPNGVLFSTTSQVTVGTLLTSTHSISDTEFLKGNYNLTGAGPGAIENQGHITVAKGGKVVLTATQVKNSGEINAPEGQVILAAGDSVSILESGSNLLTVKVNEATINALVENQGLIVSSGGQVLLTARGRNVLTDSVVNNSGIIRATSMREVNGEIILDGGSLGAVINTGTLDASGLNKGETGGTVKMAGQYLGLLGEGHIDARGAAGGGTVLIGGDYLGEDSRDFSYPLADKTVMGAKASIDASATEQGKGGKVILWSQEYTSFEGHIAAKGGSKGGEGGFVETSAKTNLQAYGSVEAGAIAGYTKGSWLLDPTDVTIVSTQGSGIGDSNGSFSSSAAGWSWAFNPANAANATIGVEAINTALNGGTNVTITTTSSGSSAGNITLNAAINKSVSPAGCTSSVNLVLNANGSININQNITVTGGTQKLNINMSAGGGINLNNTQIVTLGGNLNITAAGASTINNAAINLGGGQGDINICTSAAFTGVGLTFSGASNSLNTQSASGSTDRLAINVRNNNAANTNPTIRFLADTSLSTGGNISLSAETNGSGAAVDVANNVSLTAGLNSATIWGKNTNSAGIGINLNLTNSSFAGNDSVNRGNLTLKGEATNGGIGINMSSASARVGGNVVLQGISNTGRGVNMATGSTFTSNPDSNNYNSLTINATSNTAGNAISGMAATFAAGMTNHNLSLVLSGAANEVALSTVSVRGLSIVTTGNVTLSGAVTTNGPINFNVTGNVSASNAANALTGNLTAISGGQVNLNSSSGLNISGIQSQGAVNLNVTGGNALNINGNITTNNGTLTMSGGSFGLTNGTINTGSGAINGNFQGANASTLSNATISTTNTGSNTINITSSSSSGGLSINQTVNLNVTTGSLTFNVNHTGASGDGVTLNGQLLTTKVSGVGGGSVTVNATSSGGSGFVIASTSQGVTANGSRTTLIGATTSAAANKAGLIIPAVATSFTAINNGALTFQGNSSTANSALLINDSSYTTSGTVEFIGNNTGTGAGIDFVGGAGGGARFLASSGALTFIARAATANQAMRFNGSSTMPSFLTLLQNLSVRIDISDPGSTLIPEVNARDLTITSTGGLSFAAGSNNRVTQGASITAGQGLILRGGWTTSNTNFTATGGGSATSQLDGFNLDVGTGVANVSVSSTNGTESLLVSSATVRSSGAGRVNITANNTGTGRGMRVTGSLVSGGNNNIITNSNGGGSALFLDGGALTVESGNLNVSATITGAGANSQGALALGGSASLNSATAASMTLTAQADGAAQAIDIANNANVAIRGNTTMNGTVTGSGSGSAMRLGSNVVLRSNPPDDRAIRSVSFNLNGGTNGQALNAPSAYGLFFDSMDLTMNLTGTRASNSTVTTLNANNFTYSSSNGSFTVSGNTTIAGTSSFDALNGNVTLSNSSNSFQGRITVLNVTSVNISGNTLLRMELGAVNATGDIQIVGGNDLNLNGTVRSTNGNITLKAGDGVPLTTAPGGDDNGATLAGGNILIGTSLPDNGINASGSGKTVTIYSGNANTANLSRKISGTTNSDGTVNTSAVAKLYSATSTDTALATTNGVKAYFYYRVRPLINLGSTSSTATYKGSDYSSTTVDLTFSGVIDGDDGRSILTRPTFAGGATSVRNVGSYPIDMSRVDFTATGTALNYIPLANGTRTNGVFVISPATISISYTGSVSKYYDGTTSINQSISSSDFGTTAGLQGGDNFDQTSLSSAVFTFDSANAGARTVSVTNVSVNDGNNGRNYVVTLTSSGSGSSILPRPITVTPQTVRRDYDGTTSATTTPLVISSSTSTSLGVSGVLVPGDTLSLRSGVNFVFTDANAGASKTITTSGATDPAGAMVVRNGGNDRTGNYNIQFVNNSVSTIDRRSVTITPSVALTKTYDGTASANIGNAYTVSVADSTNANPITWNSATRSLSSGDTINSITFNFDSKNVSWNSSTSTEVANKSVVGVAQSVTNTRGQDSSNNYNWIFVPKTDNIIMRAVVTVTPSTFTKVYDGTTTIPSSSSPQVSAVSDVSGFTGGVSFVLTNAAFSFANKSAGTNKTFNVTGVTVADGNSGNNFNLQYQANTASTITTRRLILLANPYTKTYDGTTNVGSTTGLMAAATNQVSGGGIATGDTLSTNAGNFVFSDKNVSWDGQNAVANKTLVPSNAVIKDSSNQDVASNYNITYYNNTQSMITRASITLTTSGVTKVYDGSTTVPNNIANITATGGTQLFAEDSYIFRSNSVFFSGSTNVGTNKAVTVQNMGIGDTNNNENNNYNISYQNATNGEIKVRDVTLSVAPYTKTYDGTTSVTNPTYVHVGQYELVRGHAAILTGSLTPAFTDRNTGDGNKIITTVGQGGITVDDGNNGNNYRITWRNNTNSSISKANLTVSVQNYTKTYDGGANISVNTNPITLTASGLGAGGDSVRVSSTPDFRYVDAGGSASTTVKNAGTGKTITATNQSVSVNDGNSGNNYNVIWSNNTQSVIAAKEVRISGFRVNDKTYDGSATASYSLSTLAVQSEDVVRDDTVTINNGCITAVFQSPNVVRNSDGSIGAVNVTVKGFSLTGTDSANYKLSRQASDSTIVQARILPRDITVTPKTTVKEYDGTTSMTTALDVVGVTLASGQRLVGDDAFAFESPNANSSVRLVPRTENNLVIYEGATPRNSNYNIQYAANVNGEIQRRSLTITSSNVTKTYDGTASVPTTGAGAASLSGCSIPTAAAALGDGCAGGSFQFLDPSASERASVRVSGVSITNNGRTVSCLAGQTCKATAENPINYVITYTDNINSVIQKRSLTVSLPSVTKAYNGTTSASLDATPTLVQGSSFIGGHSFTNNGVVSFNDKNVGTNKNILLNGIKIGTATVDYSSNYEVQVAAASASSGNGNQITPASLTIQVNSITRTYNGATEATINLTPSATAGAADLYYVNGTKLYGKDVINRAATVFNFDNANVGTGRTLSSAQSIRIDDGNNGSNYNVVLISNTSSEIVKANLTFTITGLVKTYDGTTTAAAARLAVASGAGGLGAGDSFAQPTITYLDKNVSTNSSLVVQGGVASISITKNGANVADNYNVSVLSITGTILARPITVSANPVSKVYDGTALARSAVTLTGGTLADGDILVSNASIVLSQSGVGTGLTAQIQTGNNIFTNTKATNYQITYSPTTGTISKANITVAPASFTKTYDGQTTAGTRLSIVASDIQVNNKPALGAGDIFKDVTLNFADQNAGKNKAITLSTSSFTIGREGSTTQLSGDNYNISYLSSNDGVILPVQLTVAGLQVQTKTFDGSRTANVDFSKATLKGNIVSGDNLQIASVDASYQNGFAGLNKPITINKVILSGDNAQNYQLAPVTELLAGDIKGGEGIYASSNEERTATALPSQEHGSLSLPLGMQITEIQLLNGGIRLPPSRTGFQITSPTPPVSRVMLRGENAFQVTPIDSPATVPLDEGDKFSRVRRKTGA